MIVVNINCLNLKFCFHFKFYKHDGFYPAVALSVDSVRTTVECHVVAVSVCIESIDVVARVVGVRRRPMRKTRALLKIVSNAAVLWYVVVATTVQEVATENCVACGRVVQ